MYCNFENRKRPFGANKQKKKDAVVLCSPLIHPQISPLCDCALGRGLEEISNWGAWSVLICSER